MYDNYKEDIHRNNPRCRLHHPCSFTTTRWYGLVIFLSKQISAYEKLYFNLKSQHIDVCTDVSQQSTKTLAPCTIRLQIAWFRPRFYCVAVGVHYTRTASRTPLCGMQYCILAFGTSARQSHIPPQPLEEPHRKQPDLDRKKRQR